MGRLADVHRWWLSPPRLYGWAALFLVIAALNVAGGWWDIVVARSES